MNIQELTIEGFRSLRKVSWKPGALNVVIGQNGAGKSNLLQALEMLAVSAQGRLAKYMQNAGGMDALVWDGRADAIEFSVSMTGAGQDAYRYRLEMKRLGLGASFQIGAETLFQDVAADGTKVHVFNEQILARSPIGAVLQAASGQIFSVPVESFTSDESLVSSATGPMQTFPVIAQFQKQLISIAIYRQPNTDPSSAMRQAIVTRMEKRVDPDGQNLVAVLHTLYTTDRDFKNDINSAMRAAFGEDFDELVFPPAADQRVQLRVRWKSLKREQSAADLSDGTLRFLFLLAILASPSPAAVIAIDEPETGLHPAMLPVIAEFAQDAAKRSQVIFTTHSPQFLDALSHAAPTTTVLKCENGETKLQTLAEEDIANWLRE